MNPNNSPKNTPRIDRNLPPDPTKGPTAPPPGKYQSNVDRFPMDFPAGPWPSFRMEKAPIYCAVDNRDGHQCFKTPLSIDRKVALANFLREKNYGQMEVGYPSSNDTEFQGIQELVTKGHLGRIIPQVLTLAQNSHIDRTLESLRGAPAAIVHVYHTTARHFQARHNVTIDDIIRKTSGAIRHLKQRSQTFDGEIFLQVSSESFQDTPLDDALRFYRACIEAWQPTPDKPMIINIPNTVEREDPTFYANKVHYISDKIKEWGWRDSVIVSVHTHDDCGSAVQAARMAVMSGAADRVEGTEFGHGERSGNMSLSLFKSLLFIDGIDPEAYLSTSDDARRYEEIMGITRTKVGRDKWFIEHPEQMISDRTPFIGPETRTVSTGVHADTTYHEFETMKASTRSGMILTHLPYDPRDWGASGPIFQATSQQGVTGMAAACEQECGVRLPEWMRKEYFEPAKAAAVAIGTALTKEESFETFTSTFVRTSGAFEVVSSTITNAPGVRGRHVLMGVCVNNQPSIEVSGVGSSISDAVTKAMASVGVTIDHINFTTQYIGSGASERAVVCAEVTVGSDKFTGAGISTEKDSAFIDAVISAINRGSCGDEARIAV